MYVIAQLRSHQWISVLVLYFLHRCSKQKLFSGRQQEQKVHCWQDGQVVLWVRDSFEETARKVKMVVSFMLTRCWMRGNWWNGQTVALGFVFIC